MNGPPKVALLVETARGYGQQMLRGIIRYGRLHGPWRFYLTPGDFEQAVPRMREWGGTGIIARIETPRIAKAILDSGLPTIALDLSDKQLDTDHPLSQLSEVKSDSVGAATMAAEYLLRRGFRQFAFIGIADRVWSAKRQEGFCHAIEKAGFEVHVYHAPKSRRLRVWEREQPRLAEWLSTLPLPIAVMACNDDRGREVAEACHVAGIRIPEELALIGVDNDDLLCELADPPLSSVVLNAAGVGFRAAELLDQMMRGDEVEPRCLIAEPLSVVTRRSTDMIAIEDPDVVEALRFIHDHASEPIQVADILRQLDISRRNLELRFSHMVGRTLHAELQRIRLQRARTLLLESDLPVPKIAVASGYATPSYFIQVFRKEYGTTPSRYRRELRGDSA
ncbi:AraC family transcriptional regulator [Novipirellula artificiosorum]|uniref:Xylose operon regulatory protein n=1 Tax=Novipirellula artificiosorum TaxID=2528016 RepID=A0A5C6E251_9BACT|nr:DNA-binding transcriptional regulator [Novipirellula artificiosorum]TWU41751.1 Xylose operon regulatory protein [Novipirellula artificiosorum]